MPKDDGTILRKHSEAKVKLYETYLAIYLSILANSKFVDKIYLFDLFCGEGIYKNGGKGSPARAIQTINNHYYSNKKTCPNIEIWFNDSGKSKIDKTQYKIDRVKDYIDSKSRPNNVEVKYYKQEANSLLREAIKMSSTHKTKSLFFLDPYGYKQISPEDLVSIMSNGNSEIILWSPISQMYRFSDSALTREHFVGGEPLHDLLTTIGMESSYNSVYLFLKTLKNKFKQYLRNELGFKIYVDTYSLKPDSSNLYSIYFFTTHIKGLEAMVKAKWGNDKYRGKGYDENTFIEPLFPDMWLNEFEVALRKFITECDRTNSEVKEFSLEEGIMPKQTDGILKKWIPSLIQVQSLDGKKTIGKYTYVTHLTHEQALI